MQVQPDLVKCEICTTNVMQKCYNIHKIACSKKLNKKIVDQSIKSALSSSMIPCTQCGDSVDFSVYAAHLEECVGRKLTKCPNCKILYPTFLFEEHLNVCQVEAEQHSFQGDIEIQEEFEEEDFQLNNLIGQMALKGGNSDQPLKTNVIDSLPKKITLKSDDCSICYVKITKGTTVINLKCKHLFHPRCISAWLQKNPKCPMCRRHALS